MKFFSAIVMGFLLVTGCSSEPPLVEGVITEKRFVAAHDESYTRTEYRTEFYIENVCHSNYGPKGEYRGQTCSPQSRTRMVPYYVPDTRHVPDDWDFRIKLCTVNEDGEEKCRRQWIDVSEDLYEKCEKGNYWRKETGCELR